VKDAIFTGRDLAEALELAGRALGLSPDALRYVVLERGTPGALGLAGAPARIAVLLDGQRHGLALGPLPPAEPSPRAAEPADEIRAVVARLAEAAAVELSVRLDQEAEALRVRLAGPGAEMLLDDEGEALRALEHVLQRSFARSLAPRRLLVDCEGYRERRDARLRAMALELAAAVRLDGRPRRTQALNAYERRVIHMALGDLEDVRTFSVGEGGDRRVTIAPKDAPTAS
jgi:spoIIIJ-associated protein